MSLLLSLALAVSHPHQELNLMQVGDCQWVRGRFRFYNGSGIRRIWVIGTNHQLNLSDRDDDVPDRRFSMDNMWPREDYFARYYVCAVEPYREGEMQRVSLKGYRGLVVKKHEF
ncbi:hypothetical protein [Sphingomicrobium flavum]|uniref:hypothetical protein n=1 Tax=Sphingomicrobium flavum TaxID=1229164 RepID=UPI0021AD77CF|nr:hypothetical protein [Sphingomicrobium flavum]